MKQKSKWATRFSSLLITLAVLVAIAAVSVFAAYLRNTDDVTNSFEPADSVDPTIVEAFEDKTVKENVYFEVGKTDYPVFVRAAIVITWQNEDGIVYFGKPQDTDYMIELNEAYWDLGDDGFYYYKESVESEGSTDILIKECKQIAAAPADGYTLSVEIIVQTIQAVGYTDGENDSPEIPAWDDAGWEGADAWVITEETPTD